MVSRKAHNLKTVVRFDLPQHSASDMPKTMSLAGINQIALKWLFGYRLTPPSMLNLAISLSTKSKAVCFLSA